MSKRKDGKKRHCFRRLVFLGTVGGAVYYVWKMQNEPACPVICDLDERVVVKDEDNMGGVGLVMENMIEKYLDDPDKVRILNSLNLVIAIEPIEEPESAITMTFSGGCVVIEPGILPGFDIKLTCDYDVLMALPQMGVGLQTIRFMMTPEGQEVLTKLMSGQVKIKGIALHAPEMLKLSMFLAVPPE
jgi:hypothetical protein